MRPARALAERDQAILNPFSRAAFLSNVSVETQPNQAPRAAMSASAKDACPVLRATIAVKVYQYAIAGPPSLYNFTVTW